MNKAIKNPPYRHGNPYINRWYKPLPKNAPRTNARKVISFDGKSVQY